MPLPCSRGCTRFKRQPGSPCLFQDGETRKSTNHNPTEASNTTIQCGPNPVCKLIRELARAAHVVRAPRAGQWCGELESAQRIRPDFGPAEPAARDGVACVGATPWVTNLNIPLRMSDMAVARGIARALSQRGGGLTAVEAMALPHSAGRSPTYPDLFHGTGCGMMCSCFTPSPC